jgi:hypothetical protein
VGIFRRTPTKVDENSAFWSWFADQAKQLVFPPPHFELDAIGRRLRQVHPGLAFQIGQLDDGLVLEISADGRAMLIPIVRELCAAAPPIRGWRVCAFRQPSPAAAIGFGDRILRASELSFVMDDIVDGRAVLGVFVEGLAETPALSDASFALVQAILGELVVLTKVHEVFFVDSSERPDDAYPVSMLADFLENIGEAEREPRDWMVAEVELQSGKQLIVSLRTRIPEGVVPATFEHRVSVRCPYPDRGDGSGLPTTEQLHALKSLETALGAVAQHVMSKTGDGARESVFQVENAKDFRALVATTARELGVDCTYDVVADPSWQLWRETVTQFVAK